MMEFVFYGIGTFVLWVIANSCYGFILDKGIELEIFDKSRLRLISKICLFVFAIPVCIIITIHGLTTKLLTFCVKD
jgi:hypothetical protein